MTQADAIHATKVQKITHKTLKVFGFANLNFLFKRHRLLPSTLAVGLLDAPAAVTTNGTTDTHSATQQTTDPLQISVADWDILFCAIQLRLRNAVGDGVQPTPPPQTDDTAGHIQTTVLECITAMEQLHIALGHERRNQTT